MGLLGGGEAEGLAALRARDDHQAGPVDRETSIEMIRAKDRETAGYLRYLFNLDYLDPRHYDLVLNTGRWTVPAAAEYLRDLLNLPEISKTVDSTERLEDLALGSLVPDLRAKSITLRWGVAAVVALVALRFAVFGYKSARDHSARTLPYRRYVQRALARRPFLPRGAVIAVPAPAGDEPGAGILEDLLRVAYDDPTLRVRVAKGPPR